MNAPARMPALHAAVFVGVLSLYLASPSTAQQRRLEVTGFIGGLSVTHDLGSNSDIYLEATGEGEKLSFGKYLGFRVAYMFSRIIGVEGGYSRGTNSYTYSVDDNELGNVALGEQFDVKQTTYGGNVIVQYPFDNGVIPYGTAGFGRWNQYPENPIAGFEDGVTSNDINLGGGVRYFFEAQDLPWLGVRFDFRYHMVSEGLAFDGNEASPRFTEYSFGAVFRPF
jgi:hypothetical protein